VAASRPRFRRPLAAWLISLGGFLTLVAQGLWPVAAILAGFFVVLLGGAWLLSPWSRTARNLVVPDRATFERQVARWRRVGIALGRIPLFGIVWRGAQRLTRPTLEAMLARQGEIVDEEQRRRDNQG
jgi:hypothetical protein